MRQPATCRLAAKPLILAAALAVFAGCATTYEATLEITTTAVERLETPQEVLLHPAGDSVTVPPGASHAALILPDAPETPIEAGTRVELKVDQADMAPGVRSRLFVAGKATETVGGRLEVRVKWSSVVIRRLPPKVEKIELEMKPGETRVIEETVLYAPMRGSTLTSLHTSVRLTGPDSDDLKWILDEDIVRGRVVGRVKAPKG